MTTLDHTWREEAQELGLIVTEGRPIWARDPSPNLTQRENLDAVRLLTDRLWPKP